jgi:hypothetical protein
MNELEMSTAMTKLDRAVDEFMADPANADTEERALFENAPSLEAAITHATHGTRPDSSKTALKVSRGPVSAKDRGCEALILDGERLRASKDFHELFTLVKGMANRMGGLGEVWVYDVSVRIAAYLGKAPDRIYLHGGTREGARAFKIASTRESISKFELPRPLRKMPCHMIEDFLSKKKKELRDLQYDR